MDPSRPWFAKASSVCQRGQLLSARWDKPLCQSYQARRQHCCVHPFKLPRPQQGQPTLAYTPNVKKKHYKNKYTHICGVQWSWVERGPSSLWSYLCKLLPSLGIFTEIPKMLEHQPWCGGQDDRAAILGKLTEVVLLLLDRSSDYRTLFGIETRRHLDTCSRSGAFIGRAGGVRCEQPDWRLGFSLVWWILFCVFAFTRH